jgi:hypothetical protein
MLCIQDQEGNWIKYEDGQEKTVYNDKWVKLSVEIMPDMTVKLLVDGVEKWHTTEKITIEGINSGIWLGDRSSYFGDGLLDNLKIYER